MRRIASAAALAAATVALAGCVLTPPSAPPPPIASTQPTQPTTQPSSAPSAQPTQPAADGATNGTVEGSTAVITDAGITWRLELLDFGPAPLEELTEFAGDDGAPAPEPPSGMEVGWACFRGTLEAAPDDYGSVTQVVSEFTVPGGEDGWDYETVDRDLDLYGASGEVGDVIDRFCPIVLVPQGYDYAAVTAVTYTDGDNLEVVIPAP